MAPSNLDESQGQLRSFVATSARLDTPLLQVSSRLFQGGSHEDDYSWRACRYTAERRERACSRCRPAFHQGAAAGRWWKTPSSPSRFAWRCPASFRWPARARLMMKASSRRSRRSSRPDGGNPFIATGLSQGYGTQIPWASTSTSWSIIPTLAVDYYLNKNWSIEAICCVSPHHIQGTGSIQSTFAHTWVFPPSLLVAYHFTNFGAWQPYIGVGVNFTAYWGTRVNNETLPVFFQPSGPLTATVASVRRSWRLRPVLQRDGHPVLGRRRPGRPRLYVQRALGPQPRREIHHDGADGSRQGVRLGARPADRPLRSDLRSRFASRCRSTRSSSAPA